MGNAGLIQAVRGWWATRTGSRKVIMGTSNQNTKDLLTLKELIEAGSSDSHRPHVSSRTDGRGRMPMWIPKQKKGNVVITLEHLQ